MDRIQIFRDIVGPKNLLTGDEMERFTTDWTGAYRSEPLAVARPANTEEVSALVRAAAAANIAIVPVGGNTGLCGGTQTNSALMISMERMNKIREIREDARIAIVEPGVVLSKLHDAVKEYDLAFPLTFARPRFMVPVALAVVVYGGLIELIQPYVGRSREWADLFADALGAMIGAGLGALFGNWLQPYWGTKATHKN